MTKLEESIAKRACEIVISNRNKSLGEGGENVRTEFFGTDPDWIEYQFDPVLIAASEITKSYIETAFRQNPATKVQEMCGTVTEEELLKEFLKSEGITE